MKDKLKNILDYFESKGFQSQIEIDYEILFFSKIENDTKKCLQIEFREINNKIRLGSSINEYIQIDKVEDILKTIINTVTHYKYTISSIYGVEKGGYMLDDYFWIKKEKDFDNYIEKLDTYYQLYIAPFFETVPTLQSFNDKVLSVVPFEDYHRYLSGKFGLKAMIIMHLCKNPLYVDYVNYREEDFNTSPDLMNPESRWHKMVKNSYDEFNKFKAMVANGEV